MPTPQETQEYMDRYLGAIIKRMGEGTISYDDGLKLAIEIFSSLPDEGGIAPNAAAKSYLSSAGFNSQADVGKTAPAPISGTAPGVTGSMPVTGSNAPPGATPIAKPTSDADFWSKIGFPEQEPIAAWQRFQGLPAMGQNPFQKWLAGQATPAFSGWAATQALMPGGKGMTPFASYLAPRGGQMGQEAAYSTIDQLRGAPGARQQSWVDLVGSEGGPGLSNVLEAAMRGKGYAGFIANALANKVPSLETGWKAETMGGQQGGTYLDYLMKHLGL